jgi:tetratricopeptide (TPR) repeat protein
LKEVSDRHLTADEVAGLIGPAGPAGLAEERVAHADSCDSCRRIITMHKDEDLRIRRLAGGPRAKPTEACRPAEEWAALAAGLADAATSDALLAHASGCDACGALLHALTEDFSPEMTEAEARALGELDSAQPAWQRQMAHKLALAPRRGRVIPMPVRTWLARAAALIVGVGAGWFGWEQWIAGAPARLIAEAYTQQRPFEYRIPGAEYAAVRPQSRGSVRRSAALLEAQAKIARELEKDPESVRLLELRARSEMLGWDPEAAIATLRRALARKPGDADLMADLGMAYALRAEAQNRPDDYRSAMDYLGRAVHAKPDFAEAIFNRAVVYQRMFLYDEAAREWRRYLDLDRSGAWREEAERHRSRGR